MSATAEQLQQHFDSSSIDAVRSPWGATEMTRITPKGEEQLVELVARARELKLRLLPCGFGSKLGWAAPLTAADVLVSTRGLDGVVSLEPGDGTLAALAGTPMADLRRQAREAGYWLTPEVERPERASLGGVIGAGASGADRLRFGPVRHHVLGTRVLLADGTRARSGGRLVKNVTGYDLHRLYTGARGTLCIVLEAALRLFPEPEQEHWLTHEARDTDAMLTATRAALASPLRCTLIAAVREPGATDWKLAARLFGKRAPIDAEAKELAALWPGTQSHVGPKARASARAWRDANAPAEGATWLSIRSRPSALAGVLTTLDGAPASLRTVLHPGVCELAVSFDETPVDLAWVAALRAELSGLGARAELRNAPPPSNGDAPRDTAVAAAAAERMRALKRRLDPEGLFPELAL